MDGRYEEEDELYQCVGYCQADEDSGCCLGCGRPLYPPAMSAAARPSDVTTENRFPVDPLM